MQTSQNGVRASSSSKYFMSASRIGGAAVVKFGGAAPDIIELAFGDRGGVSADMINDALKKEGVNGKENYERHAVIFMLKSEAKEESTWSIGFVSRGNDVKVSEPVLRCMDEFFRRADSTVGKMTQDNVMLLKRAGDSTSELMERAAEKKNELRASKEEHDKAALELRGLMHPVSGDYVNRKAELDRMGVDLTLRLREALAGKTGVINNIEKAHTQGMLSLTDGESELVRKVLYDPSTDIIDLVSQNMGTIKGWFVGQKVLDDVEEFVRLREEFGGLEDRRKALIGGIDKYDRADLELHEMLDRIDRENRQVHRMKEGRYARKRKEMIDHLVQECFRQKMGEEEARKDIQIGYYEGSFEEVLSESIRNLLE